MEIELCNAVSVGIYWLQSSKIAPSSTRLPMAEQLFVPIPIAYRGLRADSHLVDAQQFGISLIGVSKLANSICHELKEGERGMCCGGSRSCTTRLSVTTPIG
jgi:hypothetical protein